MYRRELMTPLPMVDKVTVLVEVRVELEKTLRWMKLLLLWLRWRQMRLMWLKLLASLKLLTRLRCDCIELRLYLGGWILLF
jgi:hypothetical protein